jgi:hypothetical protein
MLKALRTDAVSRGLSISLLTLEIISLAISIRLFFFISSPSLNDGVNYRIEFGADLPPAIPQIGSSSMCRCPFGSRV